MKNKLEPNHTLVYWIKEFFKGGNYRIYIRDVNHDTMKRTGKNLQEKLILQLRERLKIKKRKQEELESTLVRVKRESRYAYEDLKDCMKSLKDEVKSDVVDAVDKHFDVQLVEKVVKVMKKMSRHMSDGQSDSEYEM